MPDGMTTNENRRSRPHLGRPRPHDLRFGANLIGGALFTALIMLGSAEASSPGSEALSVRALGAIFKVSQPYGAVNKEVNATPGGVHAGIDFLAQHGTPVRAVRDGTVIKAGGPYGTVAVFDGQNTVLYIHMQDIDVSKLNERITVGTFLGTVGRVGATGVHLHIEVRKGQHEVGVGCTKEEYQKTPGKGLVPSPKGYCEESSRRVADVTLDPVGYLVGAREVAAAPEAQPPASRPGAPVLPEYFGVYAVDRAGLTAVFQGTSAYKPPSYPVELYSIEDQSSKTHSALQLSADVRFLVFDQEAGQIARSVELYKLAYVQNDVQKIGAIGVRSERTQVKRINKWLAARLETLKIGLLSKPVAGQLQMVQLLPEAGLSPGLYALYYTPPPGSRIYWSFFGVQFSGTPQPLECIDITLCCPMGLGGIEVTDYLMQHQPSQFPKLMKDRYRACSSSQSQREIIAPAQPAPPTPSPAPSPGPAPRGQEALPARPTITALTRDIPDAAAFREQERVFAAAFDNVWGAAQHALSRTSLLKRQADRIVTVDRENGVLVTAPTTHSRLLGESFRRQLTILIERVTATTTRVTVKGLCYDQKGMNTWTRWDPDRCSEGFIQELEKALASFCRERKNR